MKCLWFAVTVSCVLWKRLKYTYVPINDPDFKFHCNYNVAVCVPAMLQFYATIKS
jgi:hypothetical protein